MLALSRGALLLVSIVALAFVIIVTPAVILAVPVAHAADTVVVTDAATTHVVWGWGDQVAQLLAMVRDTIIVAVLAAAGWLLRRLPKTMFSNLIINQVENLLLRAIDWGINAVTGDVRGQTLDINAGSEVAAHALRYALDKGPAWLIRYLGGPNSVLDMIIARIPLDSATTAQAVANAVKRSPVANR